jgi:cyclophilin family peptidyl-prolyl cis-trans isomerase
MKKSLLIPVLLVLAGSDLILAPAAKVQNPSIAETEKALRQSIFEAEDSRAPNASAFAVLTGAVRHANSGIRRMAVRALGRLERPDGVESIVPLLADPDATVRAEAANALGQCLHTLKTPAPTARPGGDSGAVLITAAEDRLLSRLKTERDPTVRGIIARTIGRFPYRDQDSIKAAEKAILAVAGESAARTDPAFLPALYGAAKGAESLFRLQARVASPSPELTDRMKSVVTARPDRGWDPPADETAAGARRLALMALTSANKLDEATIESAAADPDDQVRRLAMAGVGGRSQTSIPAAAVERLVRRGLRDASGMVRYEALRIYGRMMLAADPAPVFAAVEDPWPHAALLAIDLLGQSIVPKVRARELLEKLVRGFSSPGTPPVGYPVAKTWPAAARALISLARIAPDSARPFLRAFESAAAWPVRMYAARAAGILKDEAALRRLAADPHDNVREAALSALIGLKGHEADGLLIAALARPDYQLIQTAAGGLKQSPAGRQAVPALLTALARLTGQRRDTSRDPRLALLERIGELGKPEAAAGLAPYVGDFDPLIAATAAAIIERWTGRKPDVRPHPLPVVPARLEDIEKWRSALVRVTMAGNGVFELKLLVDEAPATIARFIALARSGYYNGLTFHRVAPNFLIQGGSPGANEFMGDGPYLRDEVGLESHTRGAVGISTRGRDTGDAQICPDVVDNARLDHDYTVFARIVSGMEVVDRVLECDVIERIEILNGAHLEAGSVRAAGLLCQNAVDPLGIDAASPSLSWKLAGEGRGLRQTAYRVQAAATRDLLEAGRPDLWDSGRVESDETIGIAYAGRTLLSFDQAYWRVRVWNQDAREAPWSETAAWTMGVLRPGEWRAVWIGARPEKGEPAPTLLLRREISVRTPLKRADFFVCGLGFYEATINGRRVGKDLFSPGWTKYDKTCLYDAYDVSALLHPGPNAVGILLGNGFYNVSGGRYTKFKGTFGPLKAIVLLRLEYADGTVDFVGSNGSWRTAPGPITFSCVYGGEDYDARLVRRGFDEPGFDDAAWAAAAVHPGPGGILRGAAAAAPAIRAIETLRPTGVRALRTGVDVYDLGQNVSLMPRIAVRGPAGSSVRIIPAELLAEDGSVDRRSAGGGEAYWQYILAGTGTETYFPRFFYHGSRYLQVERIPAAPGGARPEIVSLEGVVVHSSAAPVGEFACSSDLFNRIRMLVRWAQRSNMMSVLTDCPHREKLGWLEQYHLNGPSLRYEWDLSRLFAKTMNDMADSQLTDGLVPDIAPEYTVFRAGFRDSPEWGSAYVIVPWQQYEWTGDADLLRRHYDGMRRYVDYLASKAADGIVSHGLGDWYDIGPTPPGEAQLTPKALTATAFYYWDMLILSKAAGIIGRPDEARDRARRAESVKAAFNARFFNPAAGIYASGSQTAQSIALVMGLVPFGREAAVLDALVRDVRLRGDALTAGDVGFRYLLRALADGGRSDVIYEMNSRSDKPGYGFQLKAGATSLTEAWDAGPASSQNHFMLGHIIEWFYRDVAGLGQDPEDPGFKRIRFRPQPVGGLTWARAGIETVRGRVESEWRIEGKRFVLAVTVPPNTSAAVEWPRRAIGPITESERPAAERPGVLSVASGAGRTVVRVGSGRYVFESGWR